MRMLYGNPLSGCNAKMPGVRVGPLGDVILRSMVKEAPCQFRYASRIMNLPVGDISRRSAKLALETLGRISSKAKRGTSWEKELLFAYPVMLTSDVGNDDDDDMEDIFDLGDILAADFTDGLMKDKADFAPWLQSTRRLNMIYFNDRNKDFRIKEDGQSTHEGIVLYEFYG
ncbi:MAG: hypothetical protein ACLUEQ_08630 [Cloacibacillus evryensis]